MARADKRGPPCVSHCSTCWALLCCHAGGVAAPTSLLNAPLATTIVSGHWIARRTGAFIAHPLFASSMSSLSASLQRCAQTSTATASAARSARWVPPAIPCRRTRLPLRWSPQSTPPCCRPSSRQFYHPKLLLLSPSPLLPQWLLSAWVILTQSSQSRAQQVSCCLPVHPGQAALHLWITSRLLFRASNFPPACLPLQGPGHYPASVRQGSRPLPDRC